MKYDVTDEEVVIVPYKDSKDNEIEFGLIGVFKNKNIVPNSMVLNYPVIVNYKLGYFKAPAGSVLNHSIGLGGSGVLDSIKVVCSYTYESFFDDLQEEKLVFINVNEPEKVVDETKSRRSFKK